MLLLHFPCLFPVFHGRCAIVDKRIFILLSLAQKQLHRVAARYVLHLGTKQQELFLAKFDMANPIPVNVKNHSTNLFSMCSPNTDSYPQCSIFMEVFPDILARSV